MTRKSFSFFLRRHLELKCITLRVVNCAQKLTFPLLADPIHQWVLTVSLPGPGEGARLGCPRAGFRAPQPFHRKGNHQQPKEWNKVLIKQCRGVLQQFSSKQMEILPDVCFWPIIDFPVPSRRCYLIAVGRTRGLDRSPFHPLWRAEPTSREHPLVCSQVLGY